MARAPKKTSALSKGDAYTGAASNVLKEARKRNRGGRADIKVVGEASTPRLDKRARGGRTGSGSDHSPFSSAGAHDRVWVAGHKGKSDMKGAK